MTDKTMVKRTTKNTTNSSQNTTQKTKNWATRIPLNNIAAESIVSVVFFLSRTCKKKKLGAKQSHKREYTVSHVKITCVLLFVPFEDLLPVLWM